jgi:hypothetical protein
MLADQPSHVVDKPPSPASTDIKLQIPCSDLLESVPMKQIRERLQSGADRPRSLARQPPPGPTGQWPLHTTCSCQVHSRGDTRLVDKVTT